MIPDPVIQVWDETASTPLGVLRGSIDRTVSKVFCDLGSLVMSFPRNIGGASPLLVDGDRQLKVMFKGASPMWFLLDDDDSTRVSDAPNSEPLTITCRDLGGLLDEAVVLPAGGAGTTPAEYAFSGATPGMVVTTLVAQAQAAGWMQNITVAGGPSLDASGAGWPTVPNVTYKAGSTTLLAVLTGLSESGLLEWQFNDRVLELYAPASGLDRTSGYVFRPARDVLSAPLKRSRRAVATDVLVEGDAGANTLQTQTLPGRRRRAAYVSQASATGGTLADIGALYLAAHAVADAQATLEIADGPDTPAPFIDYRPGDRIGTTAMGDGVTIQRVLQVALQVGDSGATATLEVGSILATLEERFARQLSRLAPGDSSLT